MKRKDVYFISVAGFPGQLKPAAYRLGEKKESYSRISSIPIMYKEILRENPGARVKFILIVPHSLITYPRDIADYLQKNDLDEATKKLVVSSIKADLLQESLEEFKTNLNNSNENKLLERLEEIVKEVEIRVVQSRGTFPFPCGDRQFMVSFNGDPLHVFIEVFHTLLDLYEEVEADELDLFIDISHGWNAYTTLAYLGSSAFFNTFVSGNSEVRGEMRIYSSEPFSPTTTTKSLPLEGGKRPRTVGTASLGLLDMSDVVRMQKLSDSLKSINRMIYEAMSPEDILDIYFSLKGMSDPMAVEATKLLYMMRRAACALNTTIAAYLHHTLIDLNDFLSSSALLDKYLDLREKLRENEYIKGKVKEAHATDGSDDEGFTGPCKHYRVIYDRRPPLSSIILSSAFRALSSLGFPDFSGRKKDGSSLLAHSLRSPCRNRQKSYMHIALIDALREYYEKGKMFSNAILLEAEFSLVDDKGNIRSSISAINEYVKSQKGNWGTTLKLLGNFVKAALEDEAHEELRKHALIDPVSGECLPGIPSPIYSIYTLEHRRFEGPLGDLPSRTPEELWMEVMSLRDQASSDLWKRNLHITWRLLKEKDPQVQVEELRSFLRNLMAHAGIQHYSVANILMDGPQINEVFLVYYGRIFDVLNGIAAREIISRWEESTFNKISPEDVGELRDVLGCVCDIY